MEGPTAHWINLDEKRNAVTALLDLVLKDLPRLTSREDLVARQFAACGLARAARIVAGITCLVDGGYPDLAQAPARSLIEVYALSLYSLYGEEEAYEHIRGSYVRDTGLGSILPELNEAKALRGQWSGITQKINWEQLITRTLPILVPGGQTEGGQKWFTHLYDQMYRSYSIHGVHGGVGSMATHLIRDGSVLRVGPLRYEPDDGSRHLLDAGAMLASLAANVYDVFGLNADNPRQLMVLIIGRGIEDLKIRGEWPAQ